MNIRVTEPLPNSDVFCLKDVSPFVHQDTVVGYNGVRFEKNGRKTFVITTVVVETSFFVALHVAFRHKDGSGQRWFYFTDQDGHIKQLRWGQISEPFRSLVYKNLKNAPNWADPPGPKLCSKTTR